MASTNSNHSGHQREMFILIGTLSIVVSVPCMAADPLGFAAGNNGGTAGAVIGGLVVAALATVMYFVLVADWVERRKKSEAPEPVGGIRGFFGNLFIYGMLGFFASPIFMVLFLLLGIGDSSLQTLGWAWAFATAGVYFFKHT